MGSAGLPGVPGPTGAAGPTGAPGGFGVVSLVEATFTTPGLGNGETFAGAATCQAAQLLSGGYAIVATERPADQTKLLPLVSRPLDAQTWEAKVTATANTQAVVLTVTALCAGG
jgi:hypothetical protein